MNFNLIKKVILLSLVLFFGNALLTSAASTVTINNYYNLNNGQNCNLGSASISDQNCSSFVGQLGGYSFLPVSNNQMVYDSVSYGGESIVNFTNNIVGPNAVTQYVGSSIQSNIGVAYVQGDIAAVSATYLCSGPGGVRQYSVPVIQTSGVFSTFADVDTTAQDCSVTINFNQASTNSGGSNDGGGGGGDPGDNPPPTNINDPISSVSISATPESETVTYGVNTTKYFTVVVNKSADFPADILVGCDVFAVPGNGGGECAFVDGSNNPIPNTKAGGYPTAAAFGRYPSQYMAPGVSSVTLRLAVRNYDQYGGVSAVKTHTIPLQVGLLDSPFITNTFYGPINEKPVCNGSCTAGDTINLVVENPLICQATNSVNATSPAAANRTFTLSWGAVPGASTYTVEVRDQTSCVQPGCGPLVYTGTVAGTSAVIPFGGDVAGLPNKRFGYFIGTNYSPTRNSCSNIGSVLVNNPTGGAPEGPSGPAGTVNITCNGSQNLTISSGQGCTLAWTSSNVVDGTCIASGSWSGAKARSGSEPRNNITQNSSYTITCRDNNGANVTSTANVNVANAPTADIKCNGSDACTAVRFSSTPNLTWSCTNTNGGSASVSPGGYTAHPTGAATVGPFSGTSATYNLTCTSATGATATDSVTINVVNNVAPGTAAYKVDLYPDPLTFNVQKGNSWSGSAVITNIGDTTLNVSAYIDNVVSNFSGWYTPMSPTVVCPNLLPSTFYTCSIGFGGHTINVDPFTTNTFDLNFTEPTAGNRLDIPVIVNVGARPSCPSASVMLSSNTVNVGSSVTASAPSGMSNCNYSTSNAAVASLSGNPRNTVNGLSVGTSDISARCDFGDQICNVNPATINVVNPAAPSPTTYSFSVAPTSLSFSAIQNASAPASKTVTVTNTGTGVLNITRTQNMTSGPFNWGSSDSSSFSLAVGASRVVTVSINSTAGDPGNYDGTVTFTDSNAGAKQVPVALVLAPSSSVRTIDVGTNWCGTVTSSPSGISCGTTCSAGFDYNDTVTLTATPNTQCLFIGWLGDCAGQDATCDLLMTSNKSATPIFGLKPFNYEEF